MSIEKSTAKLAWEHAEAGRVDRLPVYPPRQPDRVVIQSDKRIAAIESSTEDDEHFHICYSLADAKHEASRDNNIFPCPAGCDCGESFKEAR